MKLILVATDFSKTANNAVKYAADLAKISGARLIIYNAYDTYTPINTYDLIPLPFVDLRKASFRKLRSLELRINRLYPTLQVSIAYNEGNPHEQITAYAKAKHPDLIVIGANTDNLIKRVIGSTTSELIKHSEFPVLTIPAGAKFRPLNKVLFAYDLESISEEAIKWVNQISALYSAQVDVLSLVKDMLYFEKSIPEKRDKIIKAFKGIHPEVFFSESNNFVSGIEIYIKKHKAELIITQHRKHGFFYRLVNGSTTKDLSFELSVPLLSIPETAQRSNLKINNQFTLSELVFPNP